MDQNAKDDIKGIAKDLQEMAEKKWPKTLSKKEHVQWCFDCISACEASGVRDPEKTIPKMVEALRLLCKHLPIQASLDSDLVHDAVIRGWSILDTLNDESEPAK